MTENDTLLLNLKGTAVPIKLLSKVMVWGVPYWSCLWGEVQVLLSEATLEGKALSEWRNVPYGAAND